MRFVDADNGWIVGSELGLVLRTRDGGRHWLRVADVPVARPAQLWLLDRQTLVVSGRPAGLTNQQISAVSSDAGTTWRAIAISVTQVTPNSTLWGTAQGLADAKSTDLGLTVSTARAWPGSFETGSRGTGRDGMAWALLVDPNGAQDADGDRPQWLYVSRDGGASWAGSRITLPSNRCDGWVAWVGLAEITLYQGGMGWAQSRYNLLHTSDFGQSWSPVPLPAEVVPGKLPQAGFIDARSLWLGTWPVGALEPLVQLSTDAGHRRQHLGHPGQRHPERPVQHLCHRRQDGVVVRRLWHGAGHGHRRPVKAAGPEQAVSLAAARRG